MGIPTSPSQKPPCCAGSGGAASPRCVRPPTGIFDLVKHLLDIVIFRKKMRQVPMSPLASDLDARIAAVRRFSRFYTRQLGLLQESLVHTRFSLTEARVLYELAHREKTTASELAADLDLDHGYLSRILRRFGDDGILKKVRAANDGRQSVISITAKGRKAFAPLNKGSHDQVAVMLERLPPADQQRVVGAMAAVETLLTEAP